MSDPAGFAISMPDGAQESRPAQVDVNTSHHFWFGRKLWLAGLSTALQATFLLVSGVFLLSQISATPNLAAQIALTGGLMTLGGLAMYYRALGSFLSRLSVDGKGVSGRLGWRGFHIPWTHVERWNVSQERQPLSQVPGVTVWVKGRNRPLVVPDGHLDDHSRRNIYELLHVFAYGKQAA